MYRVSKRNKNKLDNYSKSIDNLSQLNLEDSSAILLRAKLITDLLKKANKLKH